MKPPDHPTPRTDAALLSSDCACNCGHTFKLLVEEKHDQGKCVYTGPDIANGNDGVVVLADFARTLETELAAAQAELAVAQNWVEHHSQHADDLIGENARLRAEVVRLTKQIKDDNRSYGCELRDPNGTIWQQATKDHARAEKAEAERDASNKRLADCQFLLEHRYKIIQRQEPRCNEAIARAEKAEAELITEQTRLDYLALHMGTALVAHALDCDYSRCFPIRDAIDLAMKNETTL